MSLRRDVAVLPTEPSLRPAWGVWSNNVSNAIASIVNRKDCKFDASDLVASKSGLTAGSRSRWIVRPTHKAWKAVLDGVDE